MNLFDKIKALWAINTVVEKEIKEARMPTASGKPGWKTTEFWMNVAAQVGVLWGAIQGFVPSPWNAIIPIGGAAIYTICATVRKAVADIQAAKAGPAPAQTPAAS